MVEQGLKAVIYPELDEQGLQQFVQKLQEQIGGQFVNMGINAQTSDTSTSDNGSSDKSPSYSESNPLPVNVVNNDESKGGVVDESTAENKPDTDNNDNDEKDEDAVDKEEMTDAVKEGTKKADKESTEGDPSLQEKKSAPTKKSLGDVFGALSSVGSSLMAGGTSVVGYVKKLWDFLENSSPALRAVMGLFEQAFNMIWMPIGTIIAKELMPVLSNTMQKIALWMGRAWDVYDKEGWVGLIRETFLVAIDVLWDYLKGLGGVLLPMMSQFGTWILDELLKHLFGISGGIEQVKEAIGTVKKVLDWLWDKIQGAFDKVGSVWNYIVGFFTGFVNAIQEPLGLIKGFVKTIADVVKGILDFLGGTVGGIVDGAKDFLDDPVGSIQSGISSGLNTASNAIKSVIPFLADGGIVSQPTLSVVGEAGPEAVIPLNQLSKITNMNQYVKKDEIAPMINSSQLAQINNMNQYVRKDEIVPISQLSQIANQKVSNNNTVGISGGNTMNFYITGNNAMEIGDEVQRILGKTVGKASSKMMWW